MTFPNNIGIVLSGGGAKLFTHVGLLEALDDAGLLNERVTAVVGTSAGSMAGALYAVGYRPQEAWKLLYWHAWGYDDPPEDGHFWRGDERPRSLNRFLDLDFETWEKALTRNISHFKGFDTGGKIEEALRKHLDWRRREPDSAFFGTLPPEERKPLYLVALNISNRRQAVFHFEAQCRPVGIEAVVSVPAPGREVEYEYYRDVDHLNEPLEQQLQVWEAVRCSTCLPTVFRPYLKRNLTVQILDGSGQQPVTQTAYYTDGGTRDNYSLSTAIKLADCDAVFGQYLGQPEYPFQVVGHGTIIDVVDRNIGAMMQAIFEADQDDGEIYVKPVRTIIPIVRVRPDVTFDVSDVGSLKEAGYIAGAYYLWKCSSGVDDGAFLESLLDGEVEMDWDTVFRASQETWGPAAQGRQTTAPSDSNYYITRPTEAFVEMAQQVFEERYAPPVAAAVVTGVRPLGLKEELERRNRERREIEPGELDDEIFQGPLQQAQQTMVEWGQRLAWFSSAGIVAYLLTVLWMGVGLLADLGRAGLIWGEVVILLVSLVAGWLGYHWVVRTIWQRVQDLIAKKIGA